MFELSNILIFAAGVVGGAFLGVLLGRRSQTANEYVDRIRAKYEEEREQLRRRIRELESSNTEK